MPATAREKFESRGGQSGQSPSSDLVYAVTGSDDEDDIIAAVKAQAPLTCEVDGQALGDITGIAKKGREYLWVRYEDTEDDTAKALVKRPVAVYVERVYDEGNFADLGIGT